ncbi:MAG: hypothetical protein V3V00_05405, partial [Saprospiraceae bacterium]
TLCLLEISVVIVGPFHKIGIFILRPICHNPLILWFHAWLSEISQKKYPPRILIAQNDSYL